MVEMRREEKGGCEEQETLGFKIHKIACIGQKGQIAVISCDGS